MQMKPEDRPKVIGLGIAIAVILLFAIIRFVPVLLSGAGGGTAATPTNGTTDAAGITIQPAVSEQDPKKVIGQGQMRRFEDEMEPDKPVAIAAGNRSAFRPIVAPVNIAALPPVVSPGKLGIMGPQNTGGPGEKKNMELPFPPPAPPINWIDAPPLEVVLDGVYQVGSEWVAQLTILGKKGAKSTGEEVVYKKVGEKIGKFRIIRMTDIGIGITGQEKFWQVGERNYLYEGQIPGPTGASTVFAMSPQPAADPILLPKSQLVPSISR